MFKTIRGILPPVTTNTNRLLSIVRPPYLAYPNKFKRGSRFAIKIEDNISYVGKISRIRAVADNMVGGPNRYFIGIDGSKQNIIIKFDSDMDYQIELDKYKLLFENDIIIEE